MQSYRSDPIIPTVQPVQPTPAMPAGAEPQAQAIDLESSRVLRFHAKAGTTLCVLEGEIELTAAPRWLAGTVWRQPRRLPAGSVVALSPGWVEVLARQAATLRLQAPAAGPWWTRWLRLAQA
ncbi:hypothetical protein [Cupriavidus basilensis]|uniref:hypothetical protein n=1 Tax=Cupriavidus basilensis TaxID=68895 RepID=UPI00157A3518|nr:hypothetical protein [Cupriavidus basilensis]NUA31369.1 hypothetical protein [Cupriavidus basilensis]